MARRWRTSRSLTPMECLKIISICRFVLPDKELKVAGGREKVLRDVQSWIFFAGADSTMIGNYLTTYGRTPQLDHQMVRDLGLRWRVYEGGGVRPPPKTRASARSPTRAGITSPSSTNVKLPSRHGEIRNLSR